MPDAIPFNRLAKAETAPKSDASTEELLAFERMLADLSARFANVPAEKVELEIRVVQAILLRFLGFDRSTFAEFQDDGSLVVLSSTAVEGVEATPLGPLPTRLAWFVAKLRGGVFPANRPPFAFEHSTSCRWPHHWRDCFRGVQRNPYVAGRFDCADQAG